MDIRLIQTLKKHRIMFLLDTIAMLIYIVCQKLIH
ncbi:Protein CBG26650 [Caenorhabditis briggsae]|uniref:Protein CBG26650 n=1 Tax=Caenorhabditis briggsae TaxID=6238 RepID=B6IE12_CAEBR|nr:Protein CBG26650 [Caenorhabditis briggsae]CAS01076.1 Protein CBG26650 [Caenorhabditis briggsae]